MSWFSSVLKNHAFLQETWKPIVDTMRDNRFELSLQNRRLINFYRNVIYNLQLDNENIPKLASMVL